MMDSLPTDYPHDLTDRVREAVATSGRKLVALDDDPTGVQTVYDTPVLASWEVDDLAAELRDPWPVCFILTNSRSVPAPDAVRINREIARNLAEASRQTGMDFAVASRSDSTLRGHFPAETDALADELGGVDGVLLAPAFFEGGRLTIDDTHWVREGERLIPAAETEFARDATFGYEHSNLREWVEEKTGGQIPASNVASVGIEDIRGGGPERVSALLQAVMGRQPVIVNAASYRDLEVVVLGVVAAEAAGKRFLYRTGAGFVRVRAGLGERPLLSREALVGADAPAALPGLVVVGSHVRRSGEQLERLLTLANVDLVELNVKQVLDEASRAVAIQDTSRAADAALVAGRTPVIATSRQVHTAADQTAQLDISRSVSSALVEAVRGMQQRPGWVVGKGGITSSDIGTKALGARRAVVQGQIRPGIPVWRLGPETRFPDLSYVVFPGNVGEAGTLAEVVDHLRGSQDAS